jgi:hypothetical protein
LRTRDSPSGQERSSGCASESADEFATSRHVFLSLSAGAKALVVRKSEIGVHRRYQQRQATGVTRYHRDR